MSTRKIKVLFDDETIAKRNAALVEEIKARKLDNLLVVAVLKGSFIFAADLLRAMHKAGLAPEVEFVHLSSYRTATTSSGVSARRPKRDDGPIRFRGASPLVGQAVLLPCRDLFPAVDPLHYRRVCVHLYPYCLAVAEGEYVGVLPSFVADRHFG